MCVGHYLLVTNRKIGRMGSYQGVIKTWSRYPDKKRNEARQLIQKWLESRGGGVPFSEKAEVIK